MHDYGDDLVKQYQPRLPHEMAQIVFNHPEDRLRNFKKCNEMQFVAYVAKIIAQKSQNQHEPDSV
jgi:hypothetical protein